MILFLEFAGGEEREREVEVSMVSVVDGRWYWFIFWYVERKSYLLQGVIKLQVGR